MIKLRIEILGIATSLAWICSGLAVLSDNDPDDIWAYCRADDSCVIEYDHLSNQTDEPYLFLGYVMDSEQARWGQFRKAIHTYPDVQSCLVEEEQHKKEPNLLKFDWERVGTGRGAAVCMFRIARSLADVEKTGSWLKYHHFKVVGPNRSRSEDFISYRETEPVSYLAAYWSVEQYRAKTPSFIRTLTGFDTVLRYELIFDFSEASKVVGTYIVTPTK